MINCADGFKLCLVFGQIFCLIALLVTIGINMTQIEGIHMVLYIEFTCGILLLILANLERITNENKEEHHYEPVANDII